MISHSQAAAECPQGLVCISASFPGLKQRLVWPAGAKTWEDSTEKVLPPSAKWKELIGICPLFTEVPLDTWRKQEFRK